MNAEGVGPFLAGRILPSLLPKLGPAVSRFDPGIFGEADWVLLDSDEPTVQMLGIRVLSGRCRIAVRNQFNPVGKVNVSALGQDCLLVIDNSDWRGALQLNLRLNGDRCAMIVCNLEGATANLPNVFLRSSDQILFWGYGASSVDARVEIEGSARRVIIGDDALMSSGVWIRNFDMHGIFDLETMQQINSPCDTILEQHVWIGQGALLLNCKYVGGGSIVGASALVKAAVERTVAVGGLPARTIRRNMSWGRSVSALSERERVFLRRLKEMPVVNMDGL